MKKSDVRLIFILFAAAIVGFLVIYFLFSKNGNEIRITVDGELYGIYSLDEDQTIPINDTNILTIDGGEAYMSEANCPDGICVKHDPIHKIGESIVCLPNKVIVEVISEEDSTSTQGDIDGLAQ